MSGTPTVIFESFDRRRDAASFSFTGLAEVVTARSDDEVLPALRRIEAAVAGGLHAAGYISYEAAPGLATSLTAHPSGPLPLLWFGLFEKRTAITPGHSRRSSASCTAGDWSSSLTAEEHSAAIARIREYIAAGDIYQVNFTLRRRFRLTGDPAAFYRDLCGSQLAPFCAFLDTGRFKLLSASPELFFRLKDGIITVRPMKGTAPRGRWWEEDEAAKRGLREDPKERAENLMIVDLMRNDLGMVAETGSVKVTSLFDIETLPTIHQMTSTITAGLKKDTGLEALFRALFPSGSITGAPKKRAMEIIAELEASPRGVYTGCIGYISPAKQFNGFESGRMPRRRGGSDGGVHDRYVEELPTKPTQGDVRSRIRSKQLSVSPSAPLSSTAKRAKGKWGWGAGSPGTPGPTRNTRSASPRDASPWKVRPNSRSWKPCSSSRGLGTSCLTVTWNACGGPPPISPSRSAPPLSGKPWPGAPRTLRGRTR